jgi:hypothetical protein
VDRFELSPGAGTLKMMAILVGADDEADALLLELLGTAAQADLFDPVVKCLERAGLVESFWREVGRVLGYASAAPSLRDFTVSLFRAANPLDSQVALHPHARVFLRRWKDSHTHSNSFRLWSQQIDQELHVATTLEGIESRASLGDSDTFEIFEKFTVHRLCQAFERGSLATELRAVMQQRRTSFWYAERKDGYAALEWAVEMRELLASAAAPGGRSKRGNSL